MTTTPVTTPPTPPSTAAATTESTTPPVVTVAPTPTVDVEALKAEIAAAFIRGEELRDQLLRNPTLDGLEDRVGDIAVPGSPSDVSLLDGVRSMVEAGERRVTPITRRSASSRSRSSATHVTPR